ncbi:MAG TPA: FtsX-like permease family protein [Cryomorphaceae bacterium]|nr:FtsX-like permease family protein [Cryomorphaceae bacterium]
MQLNVILDITRTHLLSRLKQSSIAALGVTFGIGTFIVLMSFMTGLNKLLDGLILNRTPHVRIYNEIEPSEVQPIQADEAFSSAWNIVRSIKPKGSEERVHNALPIISTLEKDSRVKGISPQVKASVFYLAGSIELNGVVTGIKPLAETRLFNFDEYIVAGSPESLAKNRNGILLGAGVAKKMSLSIGDRIQVSTARGVLVPLKVVGIFQSGLAEVDNVQSYVNLSMGQQLLGEGKTYITDINLKLHNIEDAVPMTMEIRRVFDVSAVDIKTANAQFETGTSIRNLITYAVSITLLIVAGFGIYNILNMMIYEKMNDIAILKATGFSGDDVKNIFISQAMLIGLVGGLLGLIMGFGLSVLIDNTPFETEALPTIKTFPVNFNPMFYLGGIIFALVSTFLAGFLPARKARRIDPVEIIRGQ